MAVQNRVYPALAQLPGLSEHCGHARYVWNLAAEQQSWWRPGRGPAPSSAERYRQLAEARQAEPWLAAGSSSVQQQALRDFDRALAAFFDPKNPAGRPAYRGKHRAQGFAVRDTRRGASAAGGARSWFPRWAGYGSGGPGSCPANSASAGSPATGLAGGTSRSPVPRLRWSV